MNIHRVNVFEPYIDLGTGYRQASHLDTLAMLDEQLDAYSEPGYCLVHGSILSEVADLHAGPEAPDAAKAQEALDKSDVMHAAALESDMYGSIAGRDLVFNALRRGFMAGQMSELIRPTLRQVTGLALRKPMVDFFHLQSKDDKGFISEMLALAAPLWLDLERPETIAGERRLVGWPSYLRQDKGCRAHMADQIGSPPAEKSSFDIRLSVYDADWVEDPAERRKIQVKTRSGPQTYAEDIVVMVMNEVAELKRPSRARMLARNMNRPYGELDPMRTERLQQFGKNFLECVGLYN